MKQGLLHSKVIISSRAGSKGGGEGVQPYSFEPPFLVPIINYEESNSNCQPVWAARRQLGAVALVLGFRVYGRGVPVRLPMINHAFK